MKVSFYGHNCFFLEGSNNIVVTDPWLTDKGAFFGSWYQWPNNHHLKEELIDKLNQSIATTLYISHEHQDHFDKETLRNIQPHIDVCVIPNYEDKFLFNNLLEIGYEVVELADQSKYYLNEKDYVELMIVDTGVYHDSAAIISIDEKVFVNQNDCKIFDRVNYLEDIDVDFYAVQFSGATWHPVCYELPIEEKISISKKKKLSKLIAVRNAVKLINPKIYLPSAGPAVFPFLDHSLSLGIDNIFVHQPDIHKFLQSSTTKLAYLKPGDCLGVSNSTKPIKPPTLVELNSMKDELFCGFEHITEACFDVQLLLNAVNKRIDQIKDINFGECPKLLFDWKEQGLEIDLTQRRAEILDFKSYKMPKAYMKISASKAYFSLMHDRDYRWQDIYLSLRASVSRKPDIFNTFLNIFLFSDVSNIRSGFTTTLDIKDERIVVVSPIDGKNYEIDRYCPHNGADLKDAKIDSDGNLICPRHSWLFNLKNNGICEKADASLHAQEIVETISMCDTISVRLLKLDN